MSINIRLFLKEGNKKMTHFLLKIALFLNDYERQLFLPGAAALPVPTYPPAARTR